MSIASAVINPLLNFHGAPAYALVGGLAFAEAAIFLGFVLPGETAVIIGGVLAYRHSVSLAGMMALVIVAAITGDSVGYEVGKRYGDRLLGLKIVARHHKAIDSGMKRLRDLGGRAVLLSRFTAFLRAVTPGLAGTIGLPYRTFLVWNAAGGIIWGAGYTLLGYFAGASYKKIEDYAGKLSDVVLAVVAIAVVAWIIRGRRRERAAETGPAEDSDSGEKIP